jgi:hypothetical protein
MGFLNGLTAELRYEEDSDGITFSKLVITGRRSATIPPHYELESTQPNPLEINPPQGVAPGVPTSTALQGVPCVEGPAMRMDRALALQGAPCSPTRRHCVEGPTMRMDRALALQGARDHGCEMFVGQHKSNFQKPWRWW